MIPSMGGMGLGLGLGLTAGGVKYDFYVDSISGNDSADGRSEGAAFLTLGKVETEATAFGAGVRIGLRSGSSWRESLDLASISGVLVGRYGSGALPVIDGSDVETGWSKTVGRTNVYEASVSHDSSGTNRLTVYEDEVLLTRVDDVATCDSTAGSFVDVQGSDGSPLTVHIHTTNSDNPTSNGSTYEVSVRQKAVQLGASSSVSGIEARKAISNNGSIDLVSQANGSISGVLAAWGTKHNLGVGSGSISRSIAFGADPPTSYEPSNQMAVAFLTDPSSSSFSVRDFYGINHLGAITSSEGALFGHGSSSSRFNTFSGSQFAAYRMGSSPIVRADTFALDGVYMESCSVPPSPYAVTWTLKRMLSNQDETPITPIVTSLASTDITYEDCAFYSVANGVEFFRIALTSDWVFTQCAFYTARGGTRPIMIEVAPAGSGTITANNCVFDGDVGSANHLRVPTGWTYAGDYNVFLNDAAEPFKSYYQGSQYTTLATWQSATSQDSNSVYLKTVDQGAGNGNAFWLGISSNVNDGPVDGDFRINPNARAYKADDNAVTGTFADDSTPLTAAGPQTYWDWSLGQLASGPPTQWVTIPKTIADARSYLTSGWVFYP